MTIVENLYSHRVQDAFNSVNRILNSEKLLKQHTQKNGKNKHIRIRLECSLTSVETSQLLGLLVSDYNQLGKWNEITVSPAHWNKRWFHNVKGIEIKLHFRQEGKPNVSGSQSFSR